MKYFRLTLDPATPKAQIVIQREGGGAPVPLGVTAACKPFSGQAPLLAEITDKGEIADISFPPAQGPLLRADLAAAVQDLTNGDVQWLDVNVDGVPEKFYLANVLREIDCVDEDWGWNGKSARFAQGRAGGTAGSPTLKVREDLVRAAHMFRVFNWRTALLVSEELRRLLEAREVKGVRFIDV